MMHSLLINSYNIHAHRLQESIFPFSPRKEINSSNCGYVYPAFQSPINLNDLNGARSLWERKKDTELEGVNAGTSESLVTISDCSTNEGDPTLFLSNVYLRPIIIIHYSRWY